MHDLHLIHTDLKPENILLVSSDYVKLPQPKVFALIEKDCIILWLGPRLQLNDYDKCLAWYRVVLQMTNT